MKNIHQARGIKEKEYLNSLIILKEPATVHGSVTQFEDERAIKEMTGNRF
jgi:hypothetical protein